MYSAWYAPLFRLSPINAAISGENPIPIAGNPKYSINSCTRRGVPLIISM